MQPFPVLWHSVEGGFNGIPDKGRFFKGGRQAAVSERARGRVREGGRRPVPFDKENGWKRPAIAAGFEPVSFRQGERYEMSVMRHQPGYA